MIQEVPVVVNDVLDEQKAPNAHAQQKDMNRTKNISNFFTRSSRVICLGVRNYQLLKKNHYMLEKAVE